MWSGSECRKDLGVKSFRLPKKKDGKASNSSSKDGGFKHSKLSAKEGIARGRFVTDEMQRALEAATVLENGDNGGRASQGEDQPMEGDSKARTGKVDL